MEMIKLDTLEKIELLLPVLEDKLSYILLRGMSNTALKYILLVEIKDWQREVLFRISGGYKGTDLLKRILKVRRMVEGIVKEC